MLISSDGVKKTERIHRLVAKAFIGKIPNGYEVHHIDGDKSNNAVDNLRILTSAEHHTITKTDHPNIYEGMRRYNKFQKTKTIYMYDKNGYYLASFPNAAAASQVSGVCQRNIMQVANKDEFSDGRIRKQAGGYKWSFLPPDDFCFPRGGDE